VVVNITNGTVTKALHVVCPSIPSNTRQIACVARFSKEIKVGKVCKEVWPEHYTSECYKQQQKELNCSFLVANAKKPNTNIRNHFANAIKHLVISFSTKKVTEYF
jgi:hypothetical protein